MDLTIVLMKFHILAIAIVVIYALWMAIMHGMTADTTSGRVISVFVGLMALFLFVRRDTYLPFLGPTVLPVNAIIGDKNPMDANVEIDIDVDAEDGTKIIYWGAKSNANGIVERNPWIAYDDYQNLGVTTVHSRMARLRVQCPRQYKTHMGTLKKHIHYRVCCWKKGVMGPVKTVYVDC